MRLYWPVQSGAWGQVPQDLAQTTRCHHTHGPRFTVQSALVRPCASGQVHSAVDWTNSLCISAPLARLDPLEAGGSRRFFFLRRLFLSWPFFQRTILVRCLLRCAIRQPLKEGMLLLRVPRGRQLNYPTSKVPTGMCYQVLVASSADGEPNTCPNAPINCHTNNTLSLASLIFCPKHAEGGKLRNRVLVVTGENQVQLKPSARLSSHPFLLSWFEGIDLV